MMALFCVHGSVAPGPVGGKMAEMSMAEYVTDLIFQTADKSY